MTYAILADEIRATQARSDPHREVVRRSDDLLERIESLNLRAYGSIRFDGHSPRLADLEAVRLTNTLARAVNELLASVGLPARRMQNTEEALNAVYDAQARLFGHPDEDGDDEPAQLQLAGLEDQA